MLLIESSQIPSVAAKIRKELDAPVVAGLEEFLRLMAGDAIWNEDSLRNRRQVAYAIATTYHETAGTFQPITEYGQRQYFDKYEPGTRTGKTLGNTEPGDGYRFRGRGYVQLTGRTNYRNWSKTLEVDLLADPDRAKDPDLAYRILSEGMRVGAFTGLQIGDYLSQGRCDWVNARRVINRLDRAELIADYAQTIYGLLSLPATDAATIAQA